MNKSRAEKVGIKKGTFKKSRTEKCSAEKGRTNMKIIRQTDELTFLSFQIKNIRYSDLSEISDRLYFYI